MPSKEGNFDELIMKFYLGIGHNKTTRKKGNPKSNKTRATAFCFLEVGLDPQINAPPLTPHFDNDTKVAPLKETQSSWVQWKEIAPCSSWLSSRTEPDADAISISGAVTVLSFYR